MDSLGRPVRPVTSLTVRSWSLVIIMFQAYRRGMDEISVLDDLTADLFDLDIQVEPAADLAGYADSADCTNNGCTRSCVGC